MLKKHLYILLLCIPCILMAQNQGAGTSVFNFLDLPASSRINALGGSNVSLRDGDVSMGMCNPALLGERTDKVLQLNFSYYLPGTMFGSVLYGHNFGEAKGLRPNTEGTEADDKPKKPNYFAWTTATCPTQTNRASRPVDDLGQKTY